MLLIFLLSEKTLSNGNKVIYGINDGEFYRVTTTPDGFSKEENITEEEWSLIESELEKEVLEMV